MIAKDFVDSWFPYLLHIFCCWYFCWFVWRFVLVRYRFCISTGKTWMTPSACVAPFRSAAMDLFQLKPAHRYGSKWKINRAMQIIYLLNDAKLLCVLVFYLSVHIFCEAKVEGPNSDENKKNRVFSQNLFLEIKKIDWSYLSFSIFLFELNLFM